MNPSRHTLATHDSLIAHTLGDKDSLHFRFFKGGHLHSIRHGNDLMVNLRFGCPLAGAMHHVALELTEPSNTRVITLIGPGSEASFSISDDIAIWTHADEQMEITVIISLKPDGNGWDTEITVKNRSKKPIAWRVLHGLDIGLTSPAAARNNESYTSQYIDHHPLDHPNYGKLVASRQNLKVNGKNPYLIQACEQGCDEFATDASQVFGSMINRHHHLLCLGTNPFHLSGLKQAESSYGALLSRTIHTNQNESGTCRFTAGFFTDHPEPTNSADLTLIGFSKNPQRDSTPISTAESCRTLFHQPAVLHGENFKESDLRNFFPDDWDLVERDENGQLHSFFLKHRTSHVVTRAKEAFGPRPHAHILRSSAGDFPNASQLSTTVLMAGCFNSLLSSGHSSFHRLLSFPRETHGLTPSTGQKVWIRINDTWQVLGVPSCFEMSLNEARWIYQLSSHTIEIKVSVDPTQSSCNTSINILSADPIELLITHGLIAGINEYDETAEVEIDSQSASAIIRANREGLFRKEDPEAHFTLRAKNPASVASFGGAENFGGENGHAMLVMQTRAVNSFEIEIEGHSQLAKESTEKSSWLDDSQKLGLIHEHHAITRMNHILPWFIHNGMIHLTVPHGIEQYNGGAWGTRDVTQGSVEMLLALGRHESCREIILLTYRHQFIGENNWPQWFMTDPFGWIQQAHCHGDIPLWPLKALCDYIEASGDFAILDEQVAWTQPGSAQTTKETSPLIEHVTANIAWLRDHCVPGTALLRYGDGDWNDSLQPAKPEFRERLVSSWTVALCYQVLRRLEELSRQSGREFAGLDGFADAVKADCHRHLMIDGTICGFFLFDENSASSGQPLLHPNDKLTGIHHSLIPMTRSMLGGLFSNVEAEHHLSLIEEHLLAADGARLMDRPPAYRGGICEIFQRAELSSCFSREIGIFYTHAHLRFIETMAHLGKADAMLTAFGMVNPADLKSSVSNALPRQANAYFSSSDADVASRYEAAERYKEIVSGKIGVHGGWRIYSSGPGIFLSLVLTRMLGIRRHYGHIIIDPVLPRELNGLEATIPWENHWLNVRFEVRNATHTPSKVSLNGSELKPTKITDNPYRQGGWMIDAATFSKHLEAEHNLLEIAL
jgi:CRISPR-associated protein Csx3